MAEQLLQRKHGPTSESAVYQLLCVHHLPIPSRLNSIQIDAKDVRTLFAQVFAEESFQNYMLMS